MLSGGENSRSNVSSGTELNAVIVYALSNTGHASDHETRGTGRSCVNVVDIFPGKIAEVRVNLSAVDLDVLVIVSRLSESLELGDTSGR